MTRGDKEKAVQSLSEKLSKAKAVVLAEYRGLKVSEITELRKEVKKISGDLRVVKNRLVKKAIQGTVMDVLKSELKGPLALAIAQGDPVELTKVLARFAGNLEALKLKAGFLGTSLLSRQDIDRLSKLPGREELFAKLLGSIVAPASRLVGVMQGVSRKLVIVLHQVVVKKGA